MVDNSPLLVEDVFKEACWSLALNASQRGKYIPATFYFIVSSNPASHSFIYCYWSFMTSSFYCNRVRGILGVVRVSPIAPIRHRVWKGTGFLQTHGAFY